MFPVLGAFLIMKLCELDIHLRYILTLFFFQGEFHITWGFPGDSDGKESACCAGDLGSIPGSGRSPGEGNSYLLLQYSCLENPHGQRSLAGYRPWGPKELDMTE